MFVTNTTDSVIELIDELLSNNDIIKLKFLIYIFGLAINQQINDKNEENPNLIEDDDLIIFDLEDMGLNSVYDYLSSLVSIYNKSTNENVYMDYTNVIGINYNELEKKMISKFSKLSFYEKLDVFSEIIIRLGNDTIFENEYKILDINVNGFDIAKNINDFK